ncbi:MAG: N-acetylneuraminate synthase [Candidatus Wallbacteria bacterium]|nr:N-acetylneuraminate synthase [Candidatus Wallbacteria bacterium]
MDAFKRKPVFIIAEAGVNHNGDILIAKKMVEVAKQSGADAVKFQTFKAESCITYRAEKAEYQKTNTGVCETQLEMIRKLELDKDMHIELINECTKSKIEFLSTPFDPGSVELLAELKLSTIKIPSGEITHLPYLRMIGRLNKQIILSTGMATLGEIEKALEVLCENGTEKGKITVLQCNTEYPTPYEDVNLNAMITIRDAFKVRVGYSDHTPGIEVPIAAVALGAEIIEKHFTLDRNMVGPDHKASLEPSELKVMVDCIRNIEKALGNGVKQPSSSETKNILIARKSIVARKLIKKGEHFSETNLCAKRPGTGLSPMLWDELIGKIAGKDFETDEAITR